MFQNYLKIAVRNLLKHKVYTVINALGLSLGIASCLFILAISQYEYSYDNYHENRDRIYRLTDKIQFSAARVLHTAQTPAPWGPQMGKLYSEIERTVRFSLRTNAIKHQDNLISESILYSDPTIFDVFTYPLTKGNPATALSQTYSMVISEDMAEKYFPDEDPIGKTLLVDNRQEYVVTAVMKNIPNNSYYNFDFVAPFEVIAQRDRQSAEDWRSHWIHTYFLLREGVSSQVIEARFPDFINTHIEEEFRYRYRPELQALSDIHFNVDLSGEWGDNLNKLYIYIFSAIAVFVLLIACINFMNLATARSMNRAKEVGLRKVLGAFRRQLIRQFLTESVVISFIALFFAIGLVEFALPWFNSIAQREVSIHYFENNLYVSAVFLITVLAGILAGSYPAFFLSKFQPVGVLKGAPSRSRGAGLRKVLVTAQFSVAIFMIIANFLLIQQTIYLKTKDLGFDKENIIYFSAPENNSFARQGTIKNELKQHPAIREVFLSSSEPGDGFMWGTFLPEGYSDEKGLTLKNIAIDENYIPALKIPLVAGRNFSKAFATDSSEAVIINETAARQFGWQDPIGKRIEWQGTHPGAASRTVVGVVKDYNFESLHERVQPLILHHSPNQLFRYFMSVEPGTLEETNQFLAQQWRVYDPNNASFSYFLDVDLELDYRLEEILGDMLIRFTVLTIVIACLGLIGLASFTAAQRTKEIGIRKVLGASTNKIVVMLSGEFMKLVLLANLFAWPLAFFGMDAWLKTFAYHIDIGMGAFLACGAAAALLAWITIGVQAIRASLANPANALRYE